MRAVEPPPAPERDEAREGLERALARGAEVLSAASSVALACHVNPDADALGSMLGLGQYLAARGKRVVCSYGNQPLSPPRWLSVLDGAGLLVEAKDFPKSPEVLVALDTASPDRLGVLAQSVERAREVVVVDHHLTNAGFGTVVILDPTASSTAELVFRLVERMGGELPPGAAACLYAGIVTDTGRFQYEATTPETLRVAARLRTYPFDHTRIAQALFEENSLAALKAAAVALERAVLEPEADLVWTYLLQSDLERVSAAMADTDDFIDLLRTAREADVACVIKQQRDGRFKVSLRSKGATDVGSVAAAFGGGGHRLAAGYTSTVGLAETVRRLVAALAARRTASPGDGAGRR
ncbi:MAG TPA: bifunctional oligoribonuclease/PAP phosphatase NrnA [Actinomycetota bacterium]|nr:bifunctional oligoribonuclease/PAP phosphatase NrnA [Actinomycetota bacterium]